MTEDINRTLGEIKGTLVQFQRDTERRFDELKEGMVDANDRAIAAEKRADESHDFAHGLVKRAAWMGAGAGIVFSTLAFFIKNKAIAAILGVH
jgi:hypothetical protein